MGDRENSEREHHSDREKGKLPIIGRVGRE